jgi:hypothetical protein
VSINPALVPTEDAAWDFINEAEAHTDIADWSVREV